MALSCGSSPLTRGNVTTMTRGDRQLADLERDIKRPQPPTVLPFGGSGHARAARATKRDPLRVRAPISADRAMTPAEGGTRDIPLGGTGSAASAGLAAAAAAAVGGAEMAPAPKAAVAATAADDARVTETRDTAAAPAVAQPEPARGGKGGFGSGLLGGLISGALVAGGVTWFAGQQSGTVEVAEAPQAEAPTVDLSSYDERIAQLQAQVEALGTQQAQIPTDAPIEPPAAIAEAPLEPTPAPQTAASEASLADVETLSGNAQNAAPDMDVIGALGARLDDVDTRLDAVDTRLGEVDSRIEGVTAQVAEQPDLKAAAAAAMTQITQLREEMDQTTAQFRDAAGAATDQAKAAEAAQAEAEAARQAAQAEQITALHTELAAAVETGAPYAEQVSALAALDAPAVPEVLSAHAEEGVPTLAALRESFTAAARATVRDAVRQEASEGGAADKIGAFFKAQTGARSLTARDGDGADATLSRAEAALSAADLDTALTEIGALSDNAQETMRDWAAQATLRRDALAAAQALTQQAPSE